jgi:hypothetical protein
MPIKRKTRAPAISKTTRGRLARSRALPPTPPPGTPTPAPVPPATSPPGNSPPPPPPLSIENCLQQMDAKLQSAILEINSTFTARLESIADLITRCSTQIARPMDEDTDNIPKSGVDVLSRWPWLNKSTIESIANGTFDIHSLPKLHREEHLRFRHTTKSIEDLFMAINGTQFEHVISRTRMQSAFPLITSFLTAWQVYIAVRISFNTEHAASINYWTERLIVRANSHP